MIVVRSLPHTCYTPRIPLAAEVGSFSLLLAALAGHISVYDRRKLNNINTISEIAFLQLERAQMVFN
jgi:hypothetical protein